MGVSPTCGARYSTGGRPVGRGAGGLGFRTCSATAGGQRTALDASARLDSSLSGVGTDSCPAGLPGHWRGGEGSHNECF